MRRFDRRSSNSNSDWKIKNHKKWKKKTVNYSSTDLKRSTKRKCLAVFLLLLLLLLLLILARSAKISFDFFSFSSLLIKIKVDYETNTNDDYVKQLRWLLHPSAVYITHTHIHTHSHSLIICIITGAAFFGFCFSGKFENNELRTV